MAGGRRPRLIEAAPEVRQTGFGHVRPREDPVLSATRLDSILRTLPRLSIGLVGDLFLDRYLHCVPGSRESSIETGLEAYQVERVRNSPGALGTVLSNLAALGVGLLAPVTVIGDDGHGFDLLKALRPLPVDTSNILCAPDRLTPTYTKPLRQDAVGAWHELNRLDVRTRAPLSDALVEEVCRRLEQVFRTSDGLIVLDQLVDEDAGVVTQAVRAVLDKLARQDPEKLIYVDSRRFLGRFTTGVLKGNRSEVLSAAGCSPEEQGDDALLPALAQLSRRTGRAAYCTVGERGILVARPEAPPHLAPGIPIAGPLDIVGAGDAATSGIVTALLAGANEIEAAELGNLVASITIQQLGTTGTATPEQVRRRFEESGGSR
jgi:bifunctional ADP-heptose synthase (sugar kinase/adenylyltransferase)